MIPKDKPETSPAGRPCVVGLGASAGGLQPLEAFLTAVPADTPLAYVVVQHMDPVKKSALAALLSRVSPIPVADIEDGTRIEAGHCYIAPPGFEVTVLHGVLYLLKPAAPLPPAHPSIDAFFRSLAMDLQDRAVVVIMSGMDADGTAGARAVKQYAGAVFVQSPETAQFDVMPKSAIQAGLADLVAPAEELPGRIAAYFARMGSLRGAPDAATDQGLLSAHSALGKILLLVRAQTRHDFSAYKKGTIVRRIQRRMAIHQLTTLEEYLRHVQGNAMEAELLYKELLIGVTSFFRDSEVWDDLKNEVIPGLLAHREDGTTLRAWVAACSTGEEAYTLAMIFSEVLAGLGRSGNFSLQIFATDLDKDAIARARQGLYPESIAADVSPERLDRFFTRGPDGYRVNTHIRGMVVFAQQSIASDPPFARLDILSCRNLLIYFEGDLQKKLLPLFHHSLNPQGVLVLGSAETVGKAGDLFAPVSPLTRIYRRLETGIAGGAGIFHGYDSSALATSVVPAAAPRALPAAASLQVLADQLLVRKHAPPAVLVTSLGDIVYFSGKTGKYLEPATGKANLNLLAMARPGLSQPLSEAFYRAVRQKTPGSLEGVNVSIDGKTHRFNVTIEPLDDPETLRGLVMVVFADVVLQPSSGELPSQARDSQNERAAELMQELARSREEHQSTREEMQIAQESLLSANEELQSANEELTTSREEMQSVNEELQTVNAELQSRVDALSRASDDMENLLNSTEIATLFLDHHLHVRRFTTRATALIKLIPGDVGRPITDIVSDMDYASLADDAREVQRTLMFQEKEVSATEDRWFMVRTMPYRTQDNRIDGVVITFTDISLAKRLEASLRQVQGHQG